jgi:hypothetical protein
MTLYWMALFLFPPRISYDIDSSKLKVTKVEWPHCDMKFSKVVDNWWKILTELQTQIKLEYQANDLKTNIGIS